jgi:toxin ParE1/3/4
MIPFRFRAKARRDVEAAGDYDARRAGPDVETAFYATLDKVVSILRQEPDAGSLRWSSITNLAGLRSWPLKDFPCLVLYLRGARGIDIARVLHTSRDIPATLQE